MTSVPPIDKPIPSRRESAAQDKITRILNAALELFAERGFHGTAVPEVAKRAGVGAGTIYRYFEHKEDLVNAVFRSSKSKLKSYLLESVNLESDIKPLFHQFWQNLVKFALENPIDFRFLELQDHVPYLDTESKNTELEVLAPIWVICMRSQRQGASDNLSAEALMAMIWGAFVGLMKAHVLGYTTVNEDTLKKAEEICWQMINSQVHQ